MRIYNLWRNAFRTVLPFSLSAPPLLTTSPLPRSTLPLYRSGMKKKFNNRISNAESGELQGARLLLQYLYYHYNSNKN